MAEGRKTGVPFLLWKITSLVLEGKEVNLIKKNPLSCLSVSIK